MTIGINLKTIVKNYSLCEKLFREDCKDNNYVKGILDFFSNARFNNSGSLFLNLLLAVTISVPIVFFIWCIVFSEGAPLLFI